MSTVDCTTIHVYENRPTGFFATLKRKPMEVIKKEIAAWSDANPTKRIIGIEYYDADYYIWYQMD